MSRMNFVLAPKARRIGTPEMVSPYMEYKGDRETESPYRESDHVQLSMRITHLGGACHGCIAHKLSQLFTQVSRAERIIKTITCR